MRELEIPCNFAQRSGREGEDAGTGAIVIGLGGALCWVNFLLRWPIGAVGGALPGLLLLREVGPSRFEAWGATSTFDIGTPWPWCSKCNESTNQESAHFRIKMCTTAKMRNIDIFIEIATLESSLDWVLWHTSMIWESTNI